jgi:hypothetical protein
MDLVVERVDNGPKLSLRIILANHIPTSPTSEFGKPFDIFGLLSWSSHPPSPATRASSNVKILCSASNHRRHILSIPYHRLFNA